MVDSEELTAFVSSTLKAIKEAVDQASRDAYSLADAGHRKFEVPDSIEFDVAVTAKHSGEAGAGLKVQVFSIGGHAGGKSVDENQTVSRIKFSVPWRYTRTAPLPRATVSSF